MSPIFHEPAWLLGLASLPLLILLFWWNALQGQRALARFIPKRLQPVLVENVNFTVRRLRQAVMLLIFAALFLTLAQPRGGFVMRDMIESGRDIIVAVDVSKSMLAEDVNTTRLVRAKLAVQDLMAALPTDRFGLIAFAGSAFLQAPLTLDHAAVESSVQELNPELIPRGGTNIAAAITVALQAFGKAEGTGRALVIISDGEELEADAVAAAKEAKEKGIQIFTLGVGSSVGGEIRVPQPNGGYEYVRDRAGNPVLSRLDESRLKEIATVSDGRYLHLEHGAIATLARENLEMLETGNRGSRSERIPIERYQWPLGAALFLMFLWFVMSERRRKKKWMPAAVSAIAWAISLPLPLAAQAETPPPADGPLTAYQSGDYQKALQNFEAMQQLHPAKPEWSFNAGSAAYKAGQYERALSEFGVALASGDPALQEASRYNMGNTLFRQGEAAQAPEDKIHHWEEAIKQYDGVIEKNREHHDAIYNRDLVARLLEELKQQEEEKKQQEKQKNPEKQEEKKEQEKEKQEQKEQKPQEKEPGDQKEESNDPQKNPGDQNPKNDPQAKEEKDQQGENDGKGQNDEKDQEGKKPGEEQQPDPSQPNDEPKEEGSGAQNEKQPPQDGAGQGEDQQPQAGGPKPGESEQSKGQDQQPGESSPQGENQSQPNGEAAPVPEQVNQGQGERPKGELEAKPQGEPQEAPNAPPIGVERGGKLSEAEARALLNALQSEDDRVMLYDKQRMRAPVSRDW